MHYYQIKVQSLISMLNYHMFRKYDMPGQVFNILTEKYKIVRSIENDGISDYITVDFFEMIEEYHQTNADYWNQYTVDTVNNYLNRIDTNEKLRIIHEMLFNSSYYDEVYDEEIIYGDLGYGLNHFSPNLQELETKRLQNHILEKSIHSGEWSYLHIFLGKICIKCVFRFDDQNFEYENIIDTQIRLLSNLY